MKGTSDNGGVPEEKLRGALARAGDWDCGGPWSTEDDRQKAMN